MHWPGPGFCHTARWTTGRLRWRRCRPNCTPLVLKTDNGSPFVAWDFRDLLDDWGVVLLLSPPCTPRYDGSVASGIGSLKTGTFYKAVRNGHGSQWTSDDLDAAREQANHALRPWGSSGPTPMACWQSRPAITARERRQFRQAATDARREIMVAEGLEDESLEQLTRTARASLARAGIRRALESLGYLVVRRRRISPPFNSPLRDKFR
jgi:transposase InsO family protein